MKAVGILLLAGSSQRMGFPKLTVPLPGGDLPLLRSARALVKGGASSLVLVVGPDTRAYVPLMESALNIPCTVTDGGDTRQASVLKGLLACEGADIAIIHDGARCMVEPETVQKSIESAVSYGSGIAAIPCRDTILQQADGEVTPLIRETLYAMQTPQTFRYEEILSAYRQAEEQGRTATDDCALYLAAGYTPRLIPGSEGNIKLTTPSDLAAIRAKLKEPAPEPPTGALRCGTGEDLHLLVQGRKLMLGGVDIPFEKGLLGHSDADVLCHAITDAVLGAAGLGDIGRLFPDTDPAYEGADSLQLLKTAMERVRNAGFALCNVDATVVCQRPKLKDHIPLMQQRLAHALGADPSLISVKATTTEGVGPEGQGVCIRATAICLLRAK